MQTAQYADLAQPQTVKVFGIFHCVLAAYGFLVSILAIYPVLTLILLNRPKTKEWFAAQPE